VLLQNVVSVEALTTSVAFVWLDGVVSSKVVHHVALGTEGLATVLGARERPVVVVDTHMHG